MNTCICCNKELPDCELEDGVVSICEDCAKIGEYNAIIRESPSHISGGRVEKLKLYSISDDMYIAAYNMLGDLDTIAYTSNALVKSETRDYDVILTAEAKSIPLANEMSELSGKPYVVARKSKKVYMTDPVIVEVNSITTQHTQTLMLGQEDVVKIKGKKVLIVDDVISTGESLKAMKSLVDKCGGVYVGASCVFIEGGVYQDCTEVHALGNLPLFKVHVR